MNLISYSTGEFESHMFKTSILCTGGRKLKKETMLHWERFGDNLDLSKTVISVHRAEKYTSMTTMLRCKDLTKTTYFIIFIDICGKHTKLAPRLSKQGFRVCLHQSLI